MSQQPKEDDPITDPVRLKEWLDQHVDGDGYRDDGYPVKAVELHRDEWALIRNALMAYRQTWDRLVRSIAEAKP